MSSTYSTSLRIQLIDTGTEDEAWGQPTDNNLGTIIEQAITGVESVSLTNVSTYTLSASNAVADQSRNAVLIFTGTPTANCNVIAPSVNKVYVVKNQTSGGYTVNIKTSSGNAVVVAANTTQLVYCNAVDFKSAVNVNNIVGDLTVSGSVSVANSVTVGSTIASIYSNSNNNLTMFSTANTVSFRPTTGAFIVPIGSSAQQPATPKNGMSRWNSELGYYEIYNGTIWQAVTGSYGIQYVVVAGGGAGGGHDPGGGQYGGGGGAGGLISSSFQSPSVITSYTVIVGAGGPQGADGAPVQSGSNSSVTGDTLTAIAVGGGGGGNGRSGGTANLNGGSGGGAQSTSSSFGSGTIGQGNSGATGGSTGGGGGGAGIAASGSTGGNGIINPIVGSISGQNVSGTYYLAGGGGGGSYGTAGLGGGGFGGYPGSSNQGGSGSANTGGGAGGSGGDGGGQQLPSPGGSGIVIFKYQAPVQEATGGTVTSYSAGGYTYWIHTFTSSGTFTTT
jgi:hypothetical protein